MGEIAEDIVDGTSCSLCGTYFVKKNGSAYTHGYPVVCNGCWSDLNVDEKEIHIRQEKGIETL